MKLFKSNYGWSSSAHSKDKNGEQIKCFVDVQFAKGDEPIGEDLEGELIFRQGGMERQCFFSSYRKQGATIPKLVMMPVGWKKEKNVQTSLTGNERDVSGHFDPDLKIDADELPFY